MRAIGRTLALLVGGAVALAALAALYALVVWWRLPSVGGLGELGDGDPGETAFMRADQCAVIERDYRPLDEIDPRLACAVVHAEDTGFFRHDGVDVRALRAALVDSVRQRRLVRGASTIPMQLARNLFLERSRVPTRKWREILLARRLVARYSRRRLLELYLNDAELGPCIYGAEAAAQHYFGHSARTLDLAEATLLAAALPRPRAELGTRPADSDRVQAKQRALIERLGRFGLAAPAETRRAARELVRMWHQGWLGHTPVEASAAPERWLSSGCGTLTLHSP